MEKSEVDRQKLQSMYLEIRSLEAENIKTGKFDDKTMVRRIAQIIQKYAKEEL